MTTKNSNYTLKEYLYFIGKSILTGNSELVKEHIELKRKMKSLDDELESTKKEGDNLTLESLKQEIKYYELMRIKFYQLIKNIYQKNPILNN